MHNSKTTPLLSITIRSVQPPGQDEYPLAHPGQDRWLFGHHREVLELQPYFLPAPAPESPEGKKFQRIARGWFKAHMLLCEAEPDDALKIALRTSDTYFDRLARRAKIKIRYLEDDLHDPGRKYDLVVERTAHLLYDAETNDFASAMARPEYVAKIDRLDALADDLLAFHSKFEPTNDIRFAAVRALGNCLKALALKLRQAA